MYSTSSGSSRRRPRSVMEQDPSQLTMSEYLQDDDDGLPATSSHEEQGISLQFARERYGESRESLFTAQHDSFSVGESPVAFVDEPMDARNEKGDGFLKRISRHGMILVAISVAAVVLTATSTVLFKLGYLGNDNRMLDNGELAGNPEDPMLEAKLASTVEVSQAVVATDHDVCSEVGLAMLKKGGNAVDAAVAAVLCLGVANPASSGIGGGAFILLHMNEQSSSGSAGPYESQKTPPPFEDARNAAFRQPIFGKVLEVIDCRETAGERAFPNMFDGYPETASSVGGRAIAVPGELRGLELAHVRYGKLPWADVVSPAATMAREGVQVSSYLETAIQEHAGERLGFSGLARLLSKNQDGIDMLEAGDLLKNPLLADILERVKAEGSDAVYNGHYTGSIIQDVQGSGGILSVADLQNYKPVLRTPLVAPDVNGHTIVSVPPPSSGGATLIGMARFLSGYPNDESPTKHHRMVEAMKHAFAIRMSLSDPNYVPKLNKEATQDLTLGDYMEKLRQETSDMTTLPLNQYGGVKWNLLNVSALNQGNPVDANEGDRQRRRRKQRRHLNRFGYLEDHGTSHLSVIDNDQNAVSITTSVNTYFGSGIVGEYTGILFNSQMDDFSTPGRTNNFGLQPSPANYILPGKRPLSSMTPTFVFQNDPISGGIGDLVLALGASGGPKIITATLQVLFNTIFDNMSLFDAVAHPRLHDQLVYYEDAVTGYEMTTIGKVKVQAAAHILKELSATGHELLATGYSGCVQAIRRNLMTGRLLGVSDIRKGGRPAGY